MTLYHYHHLCLSETFLLVLFQKIHKESPLFDFQGLLLSAFWPFECSLLLSFSVLQIALLRILDLTSLNAIILSFSFDRREVNSANNSSHFSIDKLRKGNSS